MSSLAPAVGPSLPAVAVDAPRTAGEAIIWLSVLVPAFNQPAGIVRILRSLASVRGRGDIEILVSDDSTDDGAASRLAALCAAFDTAHYVRNKPALGAVPNWNALLDRARGRYCLLLHHDEEIEGTASMPALIDALKVPDAPDAWILPCCVVDRPGALPRLHFPARLAAIAACRFPAYLMRRNLIGPPSALIVRREKYLHFDTRLHWLWMWRATTAHCGVPVR